ncbi:hypothetical protein L1049_014101 [Liquidambar formosana]|uniref:AT-hook motif nuclear-localized protein n=1 Tax=Liquidambar formosana TaxID=63359 RepID=A0AAP0RPX5_LIQFO
MEDKERAISASPVNPGTSTPVTGVLPMAATGSSSMERSLARGGSGAVGGGGGEGESGGGMGMEAAVKKRKRGRPPKKNHDVNETMVFPELLPPAFSSAPSRGLLKRGRGRPKGSGKFQRLTSLGGLPAETAGVGFTPHVVIVHTGEDIMKKILSFSQKGPRSVCILSANGVVSSVIIHQPSPSGDILRFEGRFEIISLTGTCVSSETSGPRRKKCMFCVTLANSDGKVFGGVVAGSLIAAGPIQIIVGSFKQIAKKELESRLSAKSSKLAGMLDNSNLVRVPIAIAKMTKGDENYLKPTSATSNQNLKTAPFRNVDLECLQPSDLRLGERKSPNISASA